MRLKAQLEEKKPNFWVTIAIRFKSGSQKITFQHEFQREIVARFKQISLTRENKIAL